MVIKVKPLSNMIGSEIPFPKYATSGSAGMDLRACIEHPLEIAPHSIVIMPTGLSVSIPEGFAAFVFARSGLAVRSGLALANGVGVIDSDYRGEVRVALINQSDSSYTVVKGERIAQLVVMPVCCPIIELCDETDKTDRGDGGFGSTGRL